MGGEIGRAEQPLLLTGEGREQDRAAIGLAVAPIGKPGEQGDVGRVIERAVIERVAVYRLAIAVAVEMGAEDDILLPEVRAWEDGEHVGRAVAAGARREGGAEAGGDVEGRGGGGGEARERRVAAAGGEDSGRVLPRAGDEGGEGVGVEPHRRQRRVGERWAALDP